MGDFNQTTKKKPETIPLKTMIEFGALLSSGFSPAPRRQEINVSPTALKNIGMNFKSQTRQ